jgi:hypothetical protein
LGPRDDSRTISAPQQVACDLAAGQEDSPGGQDPQQRHGAAVASAENEGDQPVRDRREWQEHRGSDARAGDDGAALHPLRCVSEDLLGRQPREGNVADSRDERNGQTRERNCDRVPAKDCGRDGLRQY